VNNAAVKGGGKGLGAKMMGEEGSIRSELDPDAPEWDTRKNVGVERTLAKGQGRGKGRDAGGSIHLKKDLTALRGTSVLEMMGGEGSLNTPSAEKSQKQEKT